MTNEEAIKTIEIAIVEVEWNYPMDYAIAFENAISAIEKQIPKKPIMIGDNYSRVLSCDSCKKTIVNVWNVSEYKPKYCHYCGQALDWSDEE